MIINEKNIFNPKSNIATQYCLQNTKNGFQLAEREACDAGAYLLNKFDDVPFNFYVCRMDGALLYVNESDAATWGHSTKASIGKSIFDYVIGYDTAISAFNNNCLVYKSEKRLIIEEDVYHENFYARCLSIKLPLYLNGNIIGNLGCSIYFDRDSFSVALSKIIEMGMLSPALVNQIDSTINHSPYHLTRREKECLYHALKGKSAREISLILKLSRRTVEQYLTNVKVKMNVNNRSEMLEIAWELFSDSKFVKNTDGYF